MPKKTWFEMKSSQKPGSAEIYIYDEIGTGGVTAKQFVEDLKALGDVKSLTVHVNSPGGSVFDAQAIYSALKSHPAQVTVIVDGVAASAASLIAMAGDIIVMPENAMLMIHNPGAMTQGTAEDLRKDAEALDRIRVAVIAAYREKTGISDKELAALLDDETWLTAEEAVAKGFADIVGRAIEAVASFDLSRFENPPATPTKRGVDPVAVVEMCQKAGRPELSAGFIKNKARLVDVQARLDEVREIGSCADLVGLPTSMRDTMIRGGIRLEAARELVLDIKATLDEAIVTDTVYADRGNLDLINHAEVYRAINSRKA